MNLYCYCKNNPVIYCDSNGNKNYSVLESIGNWFKKIFSGFINLSTNLIKYSEDYFFFGYEIGVSINKIIGDDAKLLSFFAKKPNELWRFCEYQVGLKINILDVSMNMVLGFLKVSVQ